MKCQVPLGSFIWWNKNLRLWRKGDYSILEYHMIMSHENQELDSYQIGKLAPHLCTFKMELQPNCSIIVKLWLHLKTQQDSKLITCKVADTYQHTFQVSIPCYVTVRSKVKHFVNKILQNLQLCTPFYNAWLWAVI